MKKIDLAYIGGIIDGEGYISLQRNKNKNGTARYVPLVGIKMTNEYICCWLHFAFGGHFASVKIPKGKNWAPQWRWQVKGETAYQFLKVIYPFLRIKNSQAKIAMEVHKLKEPYKHRTPETRAVEEAQAIILGGLNRRGANNG